MSPNPNSPPASQSASIVEERREMVPGASALAAERGESDNLWIGTATGEVFRWEGSAARQITQVDSAVSKLAIREGRLLLQTERGDVHLLSALDGAPLRTWKREHELGALEAVTPLGPNAVIALCDRDGHPTDRCSRVMRVSPTQNVGSGQQLAICQGESIWVNETAAYAETDPGRTARIPLDGSPITPFDGSEIYRLLHADDPPGWRVSRQSPGVRVVRVDGTFADLPEADGFGFYAIIGNGRWLGTFCPGGPAVLWELELRTAVASLDVRAKAIVRVEASVVVLEVGGLIRWLGVAST